jgi:hypothetical protein
MTQHEQRVLNFLAGVVMVAALIAAFAIFTLAVRGLG